MRRLSAPDRRWFMGWQVEGTWPAAPESIPAARQWLRAQLAAQGWQVLVAELVLSELVTNAVCRPGDRVGVAAGIEGRELRLEVSDQDGAGAGAVVPRVAPLDGAGGRGLMIVDALCGSWGVIVGPPGKRVWAEMTMHAGDERPQDDLPATPR